jgi:hypothetical protein
MRISLSGNKLVNINSGPEFAPAVEEGDVLQSRRPIETDEMLRTLNTTNNNIEKITDNLYEISTKLNQSESLWALLSDSIISHDLKLAVSDLRRAGRNTAELTAAARDMAKRMAQLDSAHRISLSTFFGDALTVVGGLSLVESKSRKSDPISTISPQPSAPWQNRWQNRILRVK